MHQIMSTEKVEASLREVNTDGFLLKLNQELMACDPQLAKSLGIKTDTKKARDPGMTQQTPEELAAQEAERERVL